MNLSEIYGKTIESANGKRKGYIMGVTCENNRIARLICCDQSERSFVAESDGASFINGAVLFSKYSKAQKNAAQLRLGRAVYTEDGKYCGRLEDCTLKGFRLVKAVIGGKKYPVESLAFGDAVILKTGVTRAELAAKNMFINAVCSAGENS